MQSVHQWVANFLHIFTDKVLQTDTNDSSIVKLFLFRNILYSNLTSVTATVHAAEDSHVVYSNHITTFHNINKLSHFEDKSVSFIYSFRIEIH